VDVYKDTMNLKMLITNRGLSTSISSTLTDSRLQYLPNNRTYLGVGGYIWGLGFQVHLPLPVNWFFENPLDNESKIIDIQSTLYKKKWLVEGSFQLYRNLYVKNQTEKALPNLEQEDTAIRARRMMVSATHLFSGDQVSIKAPFSRNVEQLQSAGSWMLTNGFSSIQIKGAQSLLPHSARQDFGSDSLVSQMESISYFIRPGYAYNFVYRQFFLHLSGSAGAALQYKLFKRNGQRGTDWGVAPVFNLRAATGFDNGKYFAGVSAIIHHSRLRVHDLLLQENAQNFQLFVGYRFGEPEWLRGLRPSFLHW
jgi:hypothetical protein